MYIYIYIYIYIPIGRAGIPMEVMGLMLGQFVDDYTITCIDVFAMPQVCLFVALSLDLYVSYQVYYCIL